MSNEIGGEMQSNNKHITELPKPWKDHSFRVPEDYFDHLPDRIMQHITMEQDGVKSIRRPVIRRWIIRVSSAAAILLLGWLGVRSFYWLPHQEQLFQQELAMFIDASPVEWNEASLVDYAVEQEVETTTLFEESSTNLMEYNPDWDVYLNAESIIY